MAAVQFYWQFTTDATLRSLLQISQNWRLCTPPLETTAAHISKTTADTI